MRLTKFTDYALRALILAASAPDRNFTISEAAELYGISAPHLKKVVRTLSREGFLQGTRGRSGGFKLGRPATDIKLGAVIRVTEPDFEMVECYSPTGSCVIAPTCKLPGIIDQALAAMMESFDRHTLADISLHQDLHERLLAAEDQAISLPPRQP